MNALSADKFELYTQFFQNPSAEVERLRHICEAVGTGTALRLREDFCGTAANCVSWLEADPARVAIGVDNDEEPLHWRRSRVPSTLRDDESDRLELIAGDAISVKTAQVDVILAANCSFCVFKRRSDLLAYLSACRGRLKHGGIVVLEIYGGPDAYRCGNDRIEMAGVTAVWEQERVNQLTHEVINQIHFEFADGSRIDRAFTYDWRLWSAAELRDLLGEAGFGRIRVFGRRYSCDGRLSSSARGWRALYTDTHWSVDLVGVR